MDKQKIIQIVESQSKYLRNGAKVFLSPKPEVMAIGTIEVEGERVHMVYDPMLPPDSHYVMNKIDYDSLTANWNK